MRVERDRAIAAASTTGVAAAHVLGDYVRGIRELNLHGDAITVAAKNSGAQGRLLVIADDYELARLWIERRVGGARSVPDPALDHHVGADAAGVVPELVHA